MAKCAIFRRMIYSTSARMVYRAVTKSTLVWTEVVAKIALELRNVGSNPEVTGNENLYDPSVQSRMRKKVQNHQYPIL